MAIGREMREMGRLRVANARPRSKSKNTTKTKKREKEREVEGTHKSERGYLAFAHLPEM